MAFVDIAKNLAAVYYAARLLPDPTLDPTADTEALAAYLTTGRQLASTLLDPDPTQVKVIRCPCSTRTTHPDRPSRALAVVHHRDLLIVREGRGSINRGLRLVTHSLVDIPIARRDDFKSASVWCYECGALHELGFGWLRRARRNEVSTPIDHYPLAEWGDPITPQGYTPRHPNDAGRIAFAQTLGPLHGSTLLVTIGFPYAVDYKNHFGFRPPHEEHLFRLMGAGDPRVDVPELRDLITPQWRKHQLDPESRRLDGFNEPFSPEELSELAAGLVQLDSDERAEALSDFAGLLDPRDFDKLTQLVGQEA